MATDRQPNNIRPLYLCTSESIGMIMFFRVQMVASIKSSVYLSQVALPPASASATGVVLCSSKPADWSNRAFAHLNISAGCLLVGACVSLRIAAISHDYDSETGGGRSRSRDIDHPWLNSKELIPFTQMQGRREQAMSAS